MIIILIGTTSEQQDIYDKWWVISSIRLNIYYLISKYCWNARLDIWGGHNWLWFFFQNMHNTLFNWLIFQFAHMVPIFKLLVSSAIRNNDNKVTFVSCGWLNSKLTSHLWCQFLNSYYQVAIRTMIIKWPLVSCGWLNSKQNLHLWCQFKYFWY